jgi:uncharacterized protein YoxC
MKIFLIIVAAFVAADVLIVFYIIWRRTRRKIPEKELDKIRKTWKEIIRRKDVRHAILDADKLLDHALYLKGYKGNLGTKLKKSAPLFRNVNEVWAAHKIRNNIAHQINYHVDQKTYKKSMLAIKQAFKDLKIF